MLYYRLERSEGVRFNPVEPLRVSDFIFAVSLDILDT